MIFCQSGHKYTKNRNIQLSQIRVCRLEYVLHVEIKYSNHPGRANPLAALPAAFFISAMDHAPLPECKKFSKLVTILA
jgi:hypothetical protein